MSGLSHEATALRVTSDIDVRTADLAALGLAVVAIAIRLWAIWGVLETTVLTENLRAGVTLATEGFLGNPFSAPTGPSAHIAPMYPAIVAASIRLAGEVELGIILARTVLAVVFSVFVALLPRIAHAMGFSRRIGLATAVVFAPLLPGVFSWIEASGQHETVLTMVSALALGLFADATPHFVVQSSSRYSYPVLWSMVPFAALAVLKTRQRLRSRLPLPSSRRFTG